jgi:hypothetical protein
MRVAWRELIQDARELAPRRFIGVTMEPHRRGANTFDEGECIRSFLLADRVAKQAAEQPNVLAQRRILVEFVR